MRDLFAQEYQNRFATTKFNKKQFEKSATY